MTCWQVKLVICHRPQLSDIFLTSYIAHFFIIVNNKLSCWQVKFSLHHYPQPQNKQEVITEFTPSFQMLKNFQSSTQTIQAIH